VAKTCFFWDELEDNIVEEFDDADVTVADYTTEPDHFGNVISQHRSGQSSFFHYDALGSTLSVTDESQAVTAARAYSAFGETMEGTGGTHFSYQYVGRMGYRRIDETGIYSVRRRTYGTSWTRWLSIDPLDSFPNTRLLFSSYVYVNNNPIIYIDAAGLWATTVADDIDLPEIFPQPSRSLPPIAELCKEIPCKDRAQWEPWMCDYTDPFGVKTTCTCADTRDGSTADHTTCARLLAQAREAAQQRVQTNAVLGRFYCSPQCGGTDYGLTCWRRIRVGPRAGSWEIGVCIPLAKHNTCQLSALIEHELTHVLDLLEQWDEEGVNARIDRVAREDHAYRQQCAEMARRECLSGQAFQDYITRCTREFIRLSTSPEGLGTIARGCRRFTW
jgi:RHS repeat-associated protein